MIDPSGFAGPTQQEHPMASTNNGDPSASRRVRRQPHPDCPDCTIVAVIGDDGTAIIGDGRDGGVAVGIKLCDRHRAESDAALARHRTENPEIDAVHRMADAMRARVQRRQHEP
jgi:hypothetical protein